VLIDLTKAIDRPKTGNSRPLSVASVTFSAIKSRERRGGHTMREDCKGSKAQIAC
jgi:hypothetical protein